MIETRFTHCEFGTDPCVGFILASVVRSNFRHWAGILNGRMISLIPRCDGEIGPCKWYAIRCAEYSTIKIERIILPTVVPSSLWLAQSMPSKGIDNCARCPYGEKRGEADAYVVPSGMANGIVIVNEVPVFSPTSRRSSPPWSSTILFAMARPSPVPSDLP